MKTTTLHERETELRRLALCAPDELWNGKFDDPLDIIRHDHLAVTAEMLEIAEHPELEDFTLRSLPERSFDVRTEARRWRCNRRALGKEGVLLLPARLRDAMRC